ncbi:MAG TPA: DEAD/DEAH box helicase [Chloroflexota bacterium]|jgi:superfamily II DNA/RNA helicase|nr:DEAD/DEAH box helicase [Chloroflexota bacterium]
MPVDRVGFFGDLQVDSRLAGTLTSLGYSHPTPIQEQAIPPLRAGHDVIGLARTGSGKTAGFGIPLLESLRPGERHVQALVLVPTRELAAQVAQALTALGAASGIRVTAVYGGVGMGAQIAALRGDAQVVVGTPGRVIDHLQRGTMDLRRARFVVLDEADRMLDVGFAPAIDAILQRVPKPRQVGLFSATFPAEVESLAQRHTRDAVRVAVDQPGVALTTLEQRFVRVAQSKDKIEALHDILIDKDCRLALVFRRTTHRADSLARDLERRGLRVAALHGRRTQGQRERALAALRAGQLQVLVATDIAARGLDITGLTHVVNFDLPDTADNYTHRVGRTARMGADGVAITLVSPEDEAALGAIQRKLPATPGRGATPAQPGRARAERRDSGRAETTADRDGNRRVSRRQPQRSRAGGAHSAAASSGRPQPATPAPAGGQDRPQRRNAGAVRPARTEQAQPQGNNRPAQRMSAEDTRHADQGDAAWYPFQMPGSARPAGAARTPGRGK